MDIPEAEGPSIILGTWPFLYWENMQFSTPRKRRRGGSIAERAPSKSSLGWRPRRQLAPSLWDPCTARSAAPASRCSLDRATAVTPEMASLKCPPSPGRRTPTCPVDTSLQVTRGSSEEHLGGWACPVPTRDPGGLMPGRAARLPCPEEGGLTAELKNSSSVQLLSRVRLFATAWTAAPQVRHQRPSRSWPFGWPFYHECSVNKKTPVPQQTLLCPHPQPCFLQPQRGSHGGSR